MSKVLVISDTQIPFQHRDYLRFLQAVAKKYSINKVVHIGDEVDFHAISDWEHDPDGLSPGDELKAAVRGLKHLYRAFPVASVCTSNHTARPLRRAKKYGLPRAFLKDYAEFLEAPKGWKWAESWEIDGVIYQHGEGYSGQLGALKAASDNSQSTVVGHIHSHAGILYSATPHYLIFGMNVGCLIDTHSYAFAYGKKFRNKPIISCGVVLDGRPVIVTMELDRRGRWTKKL
jgi:hypothetical protein